MQAIHIVEAGQLKKDRGGFEPGDTIRVSVKVVEGEKERLQAFEGVVIRKRGAGTSASFTVRRISYGVGVERTFPLHSPRIDKIQVMKRATVRRSKLYYLRDLAGKAARLKEKRVAGIDEAGRGPLAGPVVAAAVVLKPGTRIAGVDDSKLLTPEEREALYAVIRVRAVAIGVGMVDAPTIDRVNILVATRRAMGFALNALGLEPELVLTDFVALDGLPCPQRNLVKGDRRSATVAAASIIAKVTRDRIMGEADREYPQYGFGRHKGYATLEHLAALIMHGPCPLHRRTFNGVAVQQDLFSIIADEELNRAD